MIAALHGKLRGLRSDWFSAGSPEFVVPVAMSLVAVLLTTVVLFAIDAQLAPQHLVLGYLFPTIFIAVYYGSTFAVLTSFAGGLAAAYFLFPPKFSFYVGDFTHAAELGFFLLLATIASKAVSVLTDDVRLRHAIGPKAARSSGKNGRSKGPQRPV
jgi:K+-sensing histidine kinase KdpD